MCIPQDPPLVLHLLTSWQSAVQPVPSPHVSAEVGLGLDLNGQSPRQKTNVPPLCQRPSSFSYESVINLYTFNAQVRPTACTQTQTQTHTHTETQVMQRLCDEASIEPLNHSPRLPSDVIFETRFPALQLHHLFLLPSVIIHERGVCILTAAAFNN